MHSPSLACYREDISLHVLLVLVLSFRTDAAAREAMIRKRAEMPVKSQEDFRTSITPCGRASEIFLRCSNTMVPTNRQGEKKKKSDYIEHRPRVQHIFHLSFLFHLLFDFSFEKKKKRFQMYVRICVESAK